MVTGGAADELRALREARTVIANLATSGVSGAQNLLPRLDDEIGAVLALIEAAQEMSELQSRSVVDLAEYDDATRSLAAAVSRLTEPQT